MGREVVLWVDGGRVVNGCAKVWPGYVRGQASQTYALSVALRASRSEQILWALDTRMPQIRWLLTANIVRVDKKVGLCGQDIV